MMEEKMICNYCDTDLTAQKHYAQQYFKGVSLPREWRYHCEKCNILRRIVFDWSSAGVRDMIEQYVFTYLYQPERSKREDSPCEMRCSEHGGNTVRDK